MMDHLKCKFVLIALWTLIFASHAPAKAPSPTSVCDAKHQRFAQVSKILKNGILQLDGGELVRLIGVLPVKQFDNPTNFIAKKLNTIARKATELLQRELEGKADPIAAEGPYP